MEVTAPALAGLADRLLLLRNAEVFAPEPLGRCDVLIAGATIAAVGPDLPIGLPDARVRDLSGLRLVPGFVDNHCHVLGGGGADGYASRVPPLEADAFLTAGTTTVVGMLGLDATTRSEEALLAQVRGLGEGGVTGYMLSGATPTHPVPCLTSSPAHDMYLVDEVIGAGEVSLSELGYLFDSWGSGAQFVAQLASELWLAARLTGKSGVVCLQIPPHHRSALAPLFDIVDRTGLPAHQFIPSHVNQSDLLLEQACRWAVEHDGWVDIGVNYDPRRGFAKASTPEDALARLLAAGAPSSRVLFSTDGGGRIRLADEGGAERGSMIMAPDSLLRCFQRLLGAGRPLDELARWFAHNPARALGLDRKGRIAPGADADVLAVDGDGALRMVVSSGQVRRHGD